MIPLVMSIIARTDTFERKMSKARRHVGMFDRAVGSSARSMMRWGRSIMVMAGVGGLGYMIRQQMKAIDSTAKLSDRLGMSTESLIGMQHGAKIAGVETETLNKSLEIFSRRLGEVDMGVGQAQYALDKLGLSYTELIGKSPDEAIGIVADQINRLETQAEKAAAANYLFGRSGQQLLNLFEKGSAGIAEYREEVKLLGLSFDRLDAAKVEAANDALTRTRAVFTGLFRQATIELAPYIEKAATAFNDWATAGEGVGANVAHAFETISLGAVESARFINSLRAEWIEFQADVQTGILALEAIKELSIGGDTGTARAENIIKLRAEADRLRFSLKNAKTEVESFYDSLRAGVDKAATAQWPDPEMSDADLWQSRMAAAEKGSDKIVKINEEMNADIEAEIRAMTDFIAAQEYERLSIAEKAMHDRKEDWLGGLDEIQAAERDLVDAIKDYQDQARADLVSFWDPVIDRSKSAKEAANDFFENFFIKLAQAKAQMAMMNLLNVTGLGSGLDWLTGGFLGGGFGGLAFHKGGTVGVDGSPRIVSPAAFVGAPRMHGGGRAGLRNDEVPIIAQKGETILPKGSGGGQTIVIENYIERVDAIDRDGFREHLADQSEFLSDLQLNEKLRNHKSRKF